MLSQLPHSTVAKHQVHTSGENMRKSWCGHGGGLRLPTIFVFLWFANRIFFGYMEKKRKGNPNGIYPICNWYIYLEPKWPCVLLGSSALFWGGLTFKNPEIFQIPTNPKKLPIFTVANPHLHRRNLGIYTPPAKLTRQKRFNPRIFWFGTFRKKSSFQTCILYVFFLRLEELLTFQQSFFYRH